MDLDELAGMIFALLVLCIIFGSIFGFPVLKERTKLKRQQFELREGGLNEAQDLIDQINRLEERIRVLERIVTDDKSELRRQFRDLGT